MPRRLRIKKADLEKYGYTVGCPGCRAANRGAPAMNHTEECRQRIMSKLEEDGDERVEQETSRLFEYLRERHGEDGEQTGREAKGQEAGEVEERRKDNAKEEGERAAKKRKPGEET